MIGRLKEAFRDLTELFTRRYESARDSGEKEVIQGSTGNVIIVKSPNTEYFKEAIFILCDDPFTRRGVDRKQLMREARRAARDYVSARVPPRDLTALRHLLFYLLGVVSSLAVLVLLELA